MSKLTNREHFSSYGIQTHCVGFYFTGIFEASGSIYIPKNRYPHIYISFHKNNLALAELNSLPFREASLAEAIKDRIGFGTIYEKKTSLSYEIFNKEGIFKFIELTKDYYRSPKIHEFNNMLEYLNTNKKCQYSLVKLDERGYETNAWLSGFLESNGGFFIKKILQKYYDKPDKEIIFYDYYRIIFELSHKKMDTKKQSYIELLSSLAKFFDTHLLDNQKTYKALNMDIVLGNYYTIHTLGTRGCTSGEFY